MVRSVWQVLNRILVITSLLGLFGGGWILANAAGYTQVYASSKTLFYDQLVMQAQERAYALLKGYSDNTDSQVPVYQGVIAKVVPEQNYMLVTQVLATVNKPDNHGVYVTLPLVLKVHADTGLKYHVTDIRNVNVKYRKFGDSKDITAFFIKDTNESPFMRFRTIFAGKQEEFAPGRYVYTIRYEVHNIYEPTVVGTDQRDLVYYTLFRQDDFLYKHNDITALIPSNWSDLKLFVDSEPTKGYKTASVGNVDGAGLDYSVLTLRLDKPVHSLDLAVYYPRGLFQESTITTALRKQEQALGEFKGRLDPNSADGRKRVFGITVASFSAALIVLGFLVRLYNRYGRELESLTVMPEFVVPKELKKLDMFALAWLYYYEGRGRYKWIIRGFIAEIFRLAQKGVLKLVSEGKKTLISIIHKDLVDFSNKVNQTRGKFYKRFKEWLFVACRKCGVSKTDKARLNDTESKAHFEYRIDIGDKCLFKVKEFASFMRKAGDISKELQTAGIWEISHRGLFIFLNVLFGFILVASIILLGEALVTSGKVSEEFVPAYMQVYGVYMNTAQMLLIHLPWIFISVVWLFWFRRKMGRLTQKGLKLRKMLLGLAEYIKRAEAHRIEVLGGKEVSAQELLKHFEEILPYALLFGMQDKWVKLVKENIDFSVLGDNTKGFNWYVGADLSGIRDFSESMNAIDVALSQSVEFLKQSGKGGSFISGGSVSGGGFSGGASSGGW